MGLGLGYMSLWFELIEQIYIALVQQALDEFKECGISSSISSPDHISITERSIILDKALDHRQVGSRLLEETGYSLITPSPDLVKQEYRAKDKRKRDSCC